MAAISASISINAAIGGPQQMRVAKVTPAVTLGQPVPIHDDATGATFLVAGAQGQTQTETATDASRGREVVDELPGRAAIVKAADLELLRHGRARARHRAARRQPRSRPRSIRGRADRAIAYTTRVE